MKQQQLFNNSQPIETTTRTNWTIQTTNQNQPIFTIYTCTFIFIYYFIFQHFPEEKHSKTFGNPQVHFILNKFLLTFSASDFHLLQQLLDFSQKYPYPYPFSSNASLSLFLSCALFLLSLFFVVLII
jgi:hypothetical protein